MTLLPSWHQEETARFQINQAFYRPASRIVRDLGVLMAAVYRSQTNRLRVLDAMSGCGVRSLRYGLEASADWVWANDSNPDLSPLLRQNLAKAIAAGMAQVTDYDATRVFFDCHSRQDYYDLVDVDCFGSAAPHLSTSLWSVAIGGLLYLTSTDGRTATGHLPEKSLGDYGAYVRNHPAAHEQGLRLLIGSVHQQAAHKHLGIEPVFALFTGETYRVMLRLVSKPALTSENYGFLGYCHHCGNYQTISWRKLGRVVCPHDRHTLVVNGPLWLGTLHHTATLDRLTVLAQQWNWSSAVNLLQLMQREASLPPYFYTLGEIGRRGQMDIPKRSRLIEALQKQGYDASPTHINAQAIKTTASMAVCIQIAGSANAF